MVVREMAKELFDHGYVSFISDSYSDSRIIKETLRNFAARQIDGLILHADMQYIMEDPEIIDILNNIPNVVVVGREFFNSPFDEIKRNLLPSLEEIVSYWVSRNRKKIYYMTNPLQRKRIDFFKSCLQEHGLNYSDNIISSNYDNRDIGLCFQTALKQKFSGKITADAIICSCDEGAAGVMDYLRDKGIKVPDDIAVCGCNNSQISAYYNPRMASIERKALEIAKLATKTLLARLKGDKSPPQKTEIRMEFIKRESAG
jgi:DNA-binding LacI/PurR family transcriptional regulator